MTRKEIIKNKLKIEFNPEKNPIVHVKYVYINIYYIHIFNIFK